MADLCRAADDPPLIHQDAATFSLSGHLFWTLERGETEALRVCSPVTQHLIITGCFNILSVCQLSMIFLSYWRLCWERLKHCRRRGYLFYFQEHGRLHAPVHQQGRKMFSPSQTSQCCSCLTALKKTKKLWTSPRLLEYWCLWDVRSSLSSVCFIGLLSRRHVRQMSLRVNVRSVCADDCRGTQLSEWNDTKGRGGIERRYRNPRDTSDGAAVKLLLS